MQINSNGFWRRVAVLIFCGTALFAVISWMYVARIQRQAYKLIVSTAAISSFADAQQQIADWKKEPGAFSESDSPEGSSRSHILQIGNGILSKLHIVPSTGMTFEIITHEKQLELVVVGMYTKESSVWIQEEFESPKLADALNLNIQYESSGQTGKALLAFSSALPSRRKASAFAFNSHCLVKPGGCSTAEQLLPAVSELKEKCARGMQESGSCEIRNGE